MSEEAVPAAVAAPSSSASNGPIIAAAVVGVAALLGGVYYVSRRRSSSSSVEKKEPGPQIPEGWKRWRGLTTSAMRGAAMTALNQHRPIGTVIPLNVDGREFGAFIEWHFDRKRGRHEGVSLLVRR